MSIAEERLTITDRYLPLLNDLIAGHYANSALDTLRSRWNLHFTERGGLRFSRTLGFVEGLYAAGLHTAANIIGTEFLMSLHYLTGGRDEAYEEQEFGKHKIRCARTKVVMTDDGDDHCFSFMVFYPITSQQIHDEVMPQVKADNKDMDDTDRYRIALQRVKARSKQASDQQYCRTWHDSECLDDYLWDINTQQRVTVHYRFAFNGGLLTRGFGDIHSLTDHGRYHIWSSHT